MSHITDGPTDAMTQLTEPQSQALEKELTLEELALVTGGTTTTDVKVKVKIKVKIKKKLLDTSPWAVDSDELDF